MQHEEEALLIRCPGCFEEREEELTCRYCGYHEDSERSVLSLPIGTTLVDRFVIGNMLGKPGSLCITYVAWDRVRKTRVVLKEFFPQLLVSRGSETTAVTSLIRQDADLFASGLEGFLAEAYQLIAIDHPNKITLRESFKANGTGYAVMDFHRGKSLCEVLEEGTRFDPPGAVELIEPILNALERLHENGLLHCDINPENIFLSEGESTNREPILMDSLAMGAAMNMGQEFVSVTLKRGYAPLELYQELSDVGPSTDVYAISATLYRMMTGIEPQEVLSRVFDDRMGIPSGVGGKVGRDYEAVTLQGLHMRPEYRIPTISAFRQLLTGKEKDRSPSRSALVVQTRGAVDPEKKSLFKWGTSPPEGTEREETLPQISAERTWLPDFSEGGPLPLPSAGEVKRSRIEFLASSWFFGGASVLALILIAVGFLYGRGNKAEIPPDLFNPEQMAGVRFVPDRIDSQKTLEVLRIADALVQEIKRPAPPVVETVVEPEPEIYDQVAVMPAPEGGLASLQERMVYPGTASEQGISGTVRLLVVIDEQGRVIQARIQERIGGGCDEEALRVVRQHRFSPGLQEGKPVKVRMFIPVTCALSERGSIFEGDRWISNFLETTGKDLAAASGASDQGQYKLADDMYQIIHQRVERLIALAPNHGTLDSVRTAVRHARSQNLRACEAEGTIARTRGETPPACR